MELLWTRTRCSIVSLLPVSSAVPFYPRRSCLDVRISCATDKHNLMEQGQRVRLVLELARSRASRSRSSST
ncbi:hypothetical protein F4820DRAFT_422805 [Hypoxylon rubiginosum]|uniref:Uncharacterized protein n=1 Tax=Hypoxylon rubiginosum TaxID=110542 RepID=A0ACB9Z0D1_9PEZI|nr:hypothetical protein F4820DRAFT_422805 [Hypoxylon rubiginosum]